MPEFRPEREIIATIVDTHYHLGAMQQPRHAAEFFLKLATDIELLRPDPEMDAAILLTDGGGTFSFAFSNHPLAVPMRPNIDVVHEVSYTGRERPINDQLGFSEYDVISIYLGSAGTMSPEPDLQLKFWQTGRKTSVSHNGELVVPIEVEAADDALLDPSLTPDDRAEMVIQAMKRARNRNTAAYQMECFIDLILLLKFEAVK